MLVAILLAAGASTRAAQDKAVAELGGKPLARWSADTLASEPRIDRLLVIERKGAHAVSQAMAGLAKPCGFWPGGETRADSVRSALRATVGADAVLVHDAARPFVDRATVARVLDALERDGAAAAALPLADTIRRADADGWAGEPLDRDGVWVMQTPQAFRYADLVKGYALAARVTDCAAAAAAAGVRVRLVRGDPLNFKVTTPEDLAFARALVAKGVFGR